MDTDKVISTLNNLIETCKDGEQGFRTAAEGLQDPLTKSVFQEYARQRAQMAIELQSEVRRLGGDPEKAGSVSGSIHRGWINIKSVVTGKDDASIIAEAERGEDVAKSVYQTAMKESLPAQTQSVIRRQAGQVLEAHDRVRAMERSAAR
jgi:uncharacterized protein (TIGR02284 family)